MNGLVGCVIVVGAFFRALRYRVRAHRNKHTFPGKPSNQIYHTHNLDEVKNMNFTIFFHSCRFCSFFGLLRPIIIEFIFMQICLFFTCVYCNDSSICNVLNAQAHTLNVRNEWEKTHGDVMKVQHSEKSFTLKKISAYWNGHKQSLSLRSFAQSCCVINVDDK